MIWKKKNTYKSFVAVFESILKNLKPILVANKLYFEISIYNSNWFDLFDWASSHCLKICKEMMFLYSPKQGWKSDALEIL